MITLLTVQFVAIFLFLGARALLPELFIVSDRAKNHGRSNSVRIGLKRRARVTRPQFAHCYSGADTGRSAGMGMMIR